MSDSKYLLNVSWYKYLIVSLVFSHLGFWSGNLFLIAPFPDLCLLVPFYINFDKCREEIASAFNDFANRWCKREGAEDKNGALKAWKRRMLTIVDKRIKSYSQNTNLYHINPNRSLVIWSRVSKNFIKSMSWFQQTRPHTMVSFFVGFIHSAGYILCRSFEISKGISSLETYF